MSKFGKVKKYAVDNSSKPESFSSIYNAEGKLITAKALLARYETLYAVGMPVVIPAKGKPVYHPDIVILSGFNGGDAIKRLVYSVQEGGDNSIAVDCNIIDADNNIMLSNSADTLRRSLDNYAVKGVTITGTILRETVKPDEEGKHHLYLDQLVHYQYKEGEDYTALVDMYNSLRTGSVVRIVVQSATRAIQDWIAATIENRNTK